MLEKLVIIRAAILHHWCRYCNHYNDVCTWVCMLAQ